MKNAELDKILKTLLDNSDTNYISSDEFRSLMDDRWNKNATDFLEKKDYIHLHRQDREPYWHIALTAEGKHFIENGGFEREEYLKEEPIRISKKAYKFSKIALIVSCLVAVLVGGVQLVCNNTQGKEINNNSNNQDSSSSSHVSDTIHKYKFVK